MTKIGNRLRLSDLFCLLYLFIIIIAPNISSASDKLPKPIFPISDYEIKKIIVEEVYYYRIMAYTPPVKVPLYAAEEDKSYKTPEEALISVLSAMFAKDYNWWLSSWTKSSQELNIEEDRKRNITPETWTQIWERDLKGKEVEITHRIEVGSYIILGYSVIDLNEKDVSKRSFESQLVFKLEDGKWLATLDLASDPVKWSWRNPEKRIRRTKQGLDEEPKEIFKGLGK